jgi:arsenate reductase-like glutaredoxin family protein
MEAHNMKPKEIVKASKKLDREAAEEIASTSKRMIVSKGKKVRIFDLAKEGVTDDAIDAMLGPTGNLRAPCLRSRQLVLVGFNEEVYSQALG